MKRKLCSALTLPVRDRWILCQAWILLLAIDLGLRVLPFQRVKKLLGQEQNVVHAVQAGEESAMIRHLGWLVGVAGHNHLYPMRCLARALVLQRLLGRRGIGTNLRIGVRKERDGLSAHAWLEYEGQPISEPETIAARFAPLLAQEAGR